MCKTFPNYVIAAALAFFAFCSPGLAQSDPGLQEWTNKEGKTMKARMLQYEPSTQSIRFATDGARLPAEYLLADLNLAGKIQALTHPNFFNAAQYTLRSSIGIRSIITATVWGVVLLVAIGIVYLIAYLLASRIVMGADPLRFKVAGYVRLFFIYLFLFLLSIGIIFACHHFLKATPEIGDAAAQLGGTLVGLLTLPIVITHLKKYYDVSTLKSVAMLVVYGIIGGLFLAMFLGAIGGLAYYGYNNHAGVVDWLLSNLVLRPMKLI